jgi:hypothetical protein
LIDGPIVVGASTDYFRIENDAMQLCLSTIGYDGICCMYGVYAICNISVIVGADIRPLPNAAEQRLIDKEGVKNKREEKRIQ